MKNSDLVPLYRFENPTVPFNLPEGEHFNRQLAGQWFDLHLADAMANLGRVIYTSGMDETLAQLAIAQVPTDKLDSFSARNHPIASRMAHFKNDYIIPRDGSIPITEIDITQVIPDRDRIYSMAINAVRLSRSHDSSIDNS
jgi:hypothetical protein